MESKYKMNVQSLSVELIDKWEDNPNAMTDEEFNALCEELDSNGLIDPIQVVGPNEKGRYHILGGHHRFDAARVIGWSEIACVVLPPEEWAGEKVEFQNIKMNVLKGKLRPDKMMKWYEDKAKKYTADALAKLTGFTDVEAFMKIVGELKKSLKNTGLPDELKDKLAETISDIKNVDDLSNILHEIFSKYGDTLKYSFMTFTYGKKEHLYIQCTDETWKAVQNIKSACLEEKVNINSLFGEILKDYREALPKAEKLVDGAESLEAKDVYVVEKKLKKPGRKKKTSEEVANEASVAVETAVDQIMSAGGAGSNEG